jgi:Ni,Fe-hydrogenase III small subunit/ferredoxin
MIFDVVHQSLQAKRCLIPVQKLLGDARGSRLPKVNGIALTPELAERAAEVCPTSALTLQRIPGGHLQLRMDYGECIGCGHCVEVAASVFHVQETFTRCGVTRERLVQSWDTTTGQEIEPESGCDPAALAREIRSLIGRALNIRQLDGGSCNGCEAEITALTNPYYDLERFGIHFVASPKHADMLLVTGPVTRNMAEAVRQTFEATASPKLVVAVGACGCSGGIFADSHAVAGAVDDILPVDGYIPGCPPTPAMLVTGILEVLRRSHQKLRPAEAKEPRPLRVGNSRLGLTSASSS